MPSGPSLSRRRSACWSSWLSWSPLNLALGCFRSSLTPAQTHEPGKTDRQKRGAALGMARRPTDRVPSPRIASACLLLGGHPLAAGSTVIISPYLVHHHPRTHRDPYRFDPDRWLPERARELSRDAYLPFGGGARKCIGEQFGLAEAVLALATITHGWRLRPQTGGRSQQAARPLLAVTLRPRVLRLRTEARHRPERHHAAHGQGAASTAAAEAADAGSTR
ncbi:cytochrome P450 [Sorangium sp. So ce1078]|uniref:cytochrome P450 n=1 Tax=Sorangium sp. So ce1078 TaxID=3133329 RepID=UPI003F5D874D